jgi:hypothetical protein
MPNNRRMPKEKFNPDKYLADINPKGKGTAMRIIPGNREIDIFTTNQPKGLGGKTDTRPDKLRGGGLIEQFKAAKAAEYLYGALHVEEAVSKGLDVKYPSDLPVPTACIRVAFSKQFSTGTNGNAFINYVPGGLLTYNIANGEQSSLTINTTCDGASLAGSNGFTQVPYFAVPQVYDKWRLTGAEMRVSYNGKILEQAGIQYSCVHYEPMRVAYRGISGAGAITDVANSNVDRLSGNVALVKNGLWNHMQTVQDKATGRTHIFTPDTNVYNWPCSVGTSSSSFGVSINNSSTQDISSLTSVSGLTIVGSNTANFRNYCWFYQGLPVSTSCLIFETFEIYEFIPDIGSVGILKLEEGLAKDYNHGLVLDRINRAASGDAPRKHTSWEKFRDTIFNRISHFGSNVVPELLTKSVLALM